MKTRLLISIFLGLFFYPQLHQAQDRCAFDEYRNLQQEKGKKVSEKVFEKWMRERIPRQRLRTQRTTEEPFKIPVVVHIIHKGEDLGLGSNIPELQVYSQIEVMNEDFQRHNEDTVLTPQDFVGLAGAVNIEFVLAKRDPNGLPTNGIVRKQGSKTQYTLGDDALLKSESYWPAEDYLNIWVCDLNANNLGYAQFPDIDLPGLENEPKENRLTDGVVIDFTAFGSSNKGAFPSLDVPYDKGRTATHEVGHFFGLLHTFATQGNCLDDDYVTDTPLQRSDYAGCPSHPQNSCESVDMFQNFMDYTDDECMNIFTMGQVERVQTVLDFAPRRSSLLNGLGAEPPDLLFYDLSVLSINKPSVISCTQQIATRITVQNLGTGPITEFAVEYGLNGGVTFYDTLSVDTLYSGEQALIDLDPIDIDEGDFTFYADVEVLNNSDFNETNNMLSKFFVIDRTLEMPPYLEEFEVAGLEEAGWTVISLDNSKRWEIENLGTNGRTAFINLHNYSSIGEQDLLVSPVFDFSPFTAATLKFRVSHAKFIEVNNGDTTEYFDDLSVLMSNNCGESFTVIYDENSDGFKIGDTDDYWQPSSDDDWKEIVLDISAYAGSPEVRIAFVSTNGFGNNIFIDNVELFVQSVPDLVDLRDREVVLFPNPTKDGAFEIGFNVREKQDVVIQIFDIEGRPVHELNFSDVLNQIYTVSLAGKRAGVYLVKVKGTTLNTTKKLVVHP